MPDRPLQPAVIPPISSSCSATPEWLERVLHTARPQSVLELILEPVDAEVPSAAVSPSHLSWHQTAMTSAPTPLPDADLVLWINSAHHLALATCLEVLDRVSSTTETLAFAAEPPPYTCEDAGAALWPDQWLPHFTTRGWQLLDPFRDPLCRNPDEPEHIAQNLLLFVRPSWLARHPEWQSHLRPLPRRQVHPARLRRHRALAHAEGATLTTSMAERWRGHPDRSTISVILTFHNEGSLAQRTLNGLEMQCHAAQAAGLEVEIVCSLDHADDQTTQIVTQHPLVRRLGRCLAVRNADCGASRNHAIDHARGAYIAVQDGDDLYSPSWLVRALQRCREFPHPVIVHPERIVSFGMLKGMATVFDTTRHTRTDLSPLTANRWIVTTFVPRVVYECLPYCLTDSAHTGFGFEDWHWNCETLAAGLEHVTAPETALFYRRRPGSMVMEHLARQSIIRPTALAGSRQFAAAFAPVPS